MRRHLQGRERILVGLLALMLLPVVGAAQVSADRNRQDSTWLAQHDTLTPAWNGHGRVWVRFADTALFYATVIPEGQPGYYASMRAWVERADVLFPLAVEQAVRQNAADSTELTTDWRSPARWRLDSTVLFRVLTDTMRMKRWGRYTTIMYSLDSAYAPIRAAYRAYAAAHPLPSPPVRTSPSPFQTVMQILALTAQRVQQQQDAVNAEANTLHNGQVTGFTKQCFYTVMGSMVVHTISSTALCPLVWP